ncbi:MAG: hypothetical protein LC667_01965 [Thioalkalivibrio sp.]|nr:hypothetical protein [Thioalkalivibrio sp.]
MMEAAPKYRKVLIERVNPFTKRVECEGLDAVETAKHLVEIYSNRNFATAGGWAIEALAIAISEGRKSTATGIDLELDDPAGNRKLYVLKSSPVTRNSDILAALKANARQAEKLIRQSNSRTFVDAVYGVAFGIRSSTYEDGVRRPSSIDLWKELTGLDDDDEAVNMVLAIATEGYREYAQASAARSLQVLRTLVATYISEPASPSDALPAAATSAVDWDFLGLRNMAPRSTWGAEDLRRHRRALEAVRQAGLDEV